ncbi:hypothetical protein [Carboxylicivirga caseinilyticus]|uniref:hypothetical protein n=1 Tax=Carboxylicivirga caseinilyticus TaxID=3417572 RepID=UPI003D33662F|nr:hypothetical protein [Marinilabiliaceae bacterium A049]
MSKYVIGQIVNLIGHIGDYEIKASKSSPLKFENGLTLPPKGIDYSFKRVDGHMEKDFEPFLNLNENMIK